MYPLNEVVYWRRVCVFVVVRGKHVRMYVHGALYAWLKRGVSRAAVTGTIPEQHYSRVASTVLCPAQLRTVLLCGIDVSNRSPRESHRVFRVGKKRCRQRRHRGIRSYFEIIMATTYSRYHKSIYETKLPLKIHPVEPLGGTQRIDCAVERTRS